ncbi:MAG: SOS response-associated peptidase family protein [Anaerolineae bacterium]|nr:SOS response-associated peptidase family protein [Anaerolineae bacterium]
MCNLYRMTSPIADVANMAKAMADPGANFAAEVYKGYQGLVVADGVARSMVWGFPRHQVSKTTGKPLRPSHTNNARDDKLLSFFWKDSFANRRCLIPVTAWAEAEGEKGRMTRTWYSLPNVEMFAVAGIWRPTDEWGDAYSMVMVNGCEQMADVHDRMPVILSPDTYRQWTDGSSDYAMALVRTSDELLHVDRTATLWSKPKDEFQTSLF